MSEAAGSIHADRRNTDRSTAAHPGVWQEWLEGQRCSRENAGLQRTLHPRAADENLIDLAGNDYLGLRGHPDVRQAAADAALTWGAGSGASRLVTGTTTLHTGLEAELAEFTGHPAALVFSTGYQANLSAVTTLADRDTLVISDAHVHASLIDAARLSRATVEVVPHNDVSSVRATLAASRHHRTLVLAESVYSVLGDAAPLPDLANACLEHDALLLVDEAHAIGVVGEHGQGLVHAHGLAGYPHVVVTATLSKALGAMGGAVLGQPSFVDHLINHARPFIFDTGLAPAAAAGALAALRQLRDHPDLLLLLHRRNEQLADRLSSTTPAGAVLSMTMPSPESALTARDAAARAGIRVGCFRPPSVPDRVSRLRITHRADLDEQRWQHALHVLGTIISHQWSNV